MLRMIIILSFLTSSSISVVAANPDDAPNTILYGGRVVTVDDQFSIADAIAIHDDRILATGTDSDIMKLAGPQTKLVPLNGRMVLPGLIDSHVHATGAAVYEFDHPIPELQTIDDVLKYIHQRTQVVKEGDWIVLNQVFITRLRDQRFPTRYELDQVAPKHPVYFRTGPDAALNSLALQLSGINRDFKITDGQPGRIETDPATGEPNGIIRAAGRFVKPQSDEQQPSFDERRVQLQKLLADYNSVGITSIVQRSAGESDVKLFDALKQSKELTCRTFLCWGVNPVGEWEQVSEQILQAAKHPAHTYDNQLWLRGVKVFLDGGMLTGSAWMQKPWGVSSVYSITDPEYRGVLNIEPDRLYQISKLCLENDLQITAHAVGDGAVQALIDAYARVNEDVSIAGKRPCITHCNFMSPKSIDQMQQLEIVADIQPIWLRLDGRTLLHQFGEERTAWFQPYKTLFERGVKVGGGSDHMQKIGSLRSVNPYNPFLGIWTMLTRQPRWSDEPLHPEQIVSREDAIRFYTINNAWLTFEEKEKGSLEPGKLADMIVLGTDLLNCPLEDVKDIQVDQTWLGGEIVYQRQ
jgi:predicted amidohydrolase YtcJ